MTESDPQGRQPEAVTLQETPHPTRRGRTLVIASVAGAIVGTALGYALSTAVGLPPETAAMITAGGGLEGALALPIIIADR